MTIRQENHIITLRPRLDLFRPIDNGLLKKAASNALKCLEKPLALTLVVNDPQRQTNSPRVLKVLSHLIDPACIRILVATGTHRYSSEKMRSFELKLIQGLPIEEIQWHDSQSDELVPVRPNGWRVHPWLVGDRPVLAIGSVEPHYFAGFTGAHKTLTIGCASYADVEFNHASLMDFSSDLPLLKQAWHKKINSPQTTSIGRLFDAAAALCGVCSVASYEGQGPMELEALANKLNTHIELPLNKINGCYVADWEPLILALLTTSSSRSEQSSLFHHSLAVMLLQQARAIRNDYATNIVSFSGGVFQNKVLTESAISLLEADGFRVCLAEEIPLNDAGISFGQLIEYGFKQAQ